MQEKKETNRIKISLQAHFMAVVDCDGIKKMVGILFCTLCNQVTYQPMWKPMTIRATDGGGDVEGSGKSQMALGKKGVIAMAQYYIIRSAIKSNTSE